jgi:hypothetical protein
MSASNLAASRRALHRRHAGAPKFSICVETSFKAVRKGPGQLHMRRDALQARHIGNPFRVSRHRDHHVGKRHNHPCGFKSRGELSRFRG